MSGKKTISGPYRATKLWNDAVRSFYHGMPVGGHWRGLRHYDRCFTASEAIAWLHHHLRHDTNFGASVSRDQTTKLLRKFVKAGLIEDVRGSSYTHQEEFKDSKDLYRFSSRSPLKALRTPRTPGRPPLSSLHSNNKCEEGASPMLSKRLPGSFRESIRSKSRAGPRDCKENAANERKDLGNQECGSEGESQGQLQKCHLVAKTLTKEETNQVWRKVYLQQLEQVCQELLYCPANTVVNIEGVSGELVRHNMTQVSARGVVTIPLGQPDPLPSWLITAMRCLADWPNMSDPSVNIPNYPGVERDVFNILRDYFTNLAEPLIPYQLYDAVVRLYIGAEFLDISLRSHSPDPTSLSHDQNNSDVDFEDTDSVDDLMLNMSIGGGEGQQKTSTPNMETEDSQSIVPGRRAGVRPSTPQMSSLSKNVSLNGFKKLSSFSGDGACNVDSKNGGMNVMHSESISAPQTPSLGKRMALNTSRLQSLKLRRLKEYTHFKDDSLYPTHSLSLASSQEDLELRHGSSPEGQENIQPQGQVTRLTETVRSIKSHDQVRRMRRSEIERQEGKWPPHNCCFETAFTSDSPHTRIIPQQSVDSLHVRQSHGNRGADHRPRPRSIAAPSRPTSETRPGCTPREPDVSTVSDLFKSSIMSGTNTPLTTMDQHPRNTLDGSRYLTALERSPLNRSRSAGNLEDVESIRVSPHPQASASEHDVAQIGVPTKSLATRIRDSIKRKHLRDDSLSRGRSERSHNLDRLRTKSGGFVNLALAPASSPDYENSESGMCDGRVEATHLRTKSGGFLNLALAPSTDSVDSAPLSTRSDSALLDHSRVTVHHSQQASLDCPVTSRLPVRPSSTGEHRMRSISPPGQDYIYRRLTTPDGCLSHSLASSGCSSLYHSALTQTPSPHDPPLPPRLPRTALIVPTAHCKPASPPPPPAAEYVNLLPHPSAGPYPAAGSSRLPHSPHPNTRLPPIHPHASPSVRLIGRRARTRVGAEKFPGSRACLPGLLTREGREAAISSFQLLLLTLPPSLRRSLHLLLRVCSKMATNDCLHLHPHLTTRALVLTTFLRGVLLSPHEADYDEILAQRIVAFLVDHHAAILRPPDHLAVLVHRAITTLQRPQISPSDYQRQKLSGSQLFLADLLDQIVDNEKLSTKECKRKLKEFKSHYPEIYRVRFPSDPGKRESRMKGLMKLASLSSLSRTKAIRM
ncbi:hypothetical protein Pmani_021048 [Petrolisthes manimaculis]|uniref:DEP domain-containing protein n=1 Tax=Petrolisthes manimaculis TaxID=1843537 RepID=A0AAE1PEZ5_9EUCA|nr:hypothetical protein Pmani_021048 [Petrolisthes manimaculis]